VPDPNDRDALHAARYTPWPQRATTALRGYAARIVITMVGAVEFRDISRSTPASDPSPG
jgi:hypothetical protein